MDQRTANEMIRIHTDRARALWRAAERTMSPTARAAIMLRADVEQRAAVQWTMAARQRGTISTTYAGSDSCRS